MSCSAVINACTGSKKKGDRRYTSLSDVKYRSEALYISYVGKNILKAFSLNYQKTPSTI